MRGVYERNTNSTILQLWKMRYEDEMRTRAREENIFEICAKI